MPNNIKLTDEQLDKVIGGNDEGQTAEIPALVNGMCHKEKLTPHNCEECRSCVYKTEKGMNALGTHKIYECLQFNCEFYVFVGNN